MDFSQAEQAFGRVAPSPESCDFCALRLVDETAERLSVRQNVPQPYSRQRDRGGMVTVYHQGGFGYAATSDLSEVGIKKAIDQAVNWAERTASRSIGYPGLVMPHPQGRYATTVKRPWSETSTGEKYDQLRAASNDLGGHADLVDWEAGLWFTDHQTLYLTNGGGRAETSLSLVAPHVGVTANRGTDTQTRSFGAYGESQQGGLEVLDRVGFGSKGPQLRQEVLELLDAPDCPVGDMTLVLAPDQMMLQIHESIGHPIELDRILGDERNYAGTSFVTLDMFGKYQYGSSLLNVSFDPTRTNEFASYGHDDDGVEAERTMLIENGLLKRPLGSVVSQSRATTAGTANARATSWNRPPIDRMANLNIEPGDKSFDELIKGIELGVLMTTNKSWSIDDSRNKFQFGCEMGQVIENGELKHRVKNPNYRGISATFWRNLSAVGNDATLEVLGTPYCGKGEPNQVIRVGHASPVCAFDNVAIFGGA